MQHLSPLFQDLSLFTGAPQVAYDANDLEFMAAPVVQGYLQDRWLGPDYILLALQEKGATFHYQVGAHAAGGRGGGLVGGAAGGACACVRACVRACVTPLGDAGLGSRWRVPYGRHMDLLPLRC